MRPWHPIRSFVLPALIFGLVVGCGGDGAGVNSAVNRRKNNPPVVTGMLVNGASPTAANLLQYKSYNLMAQASDPDIGDSLVRFDWDFGGSSSIITTNSSTLPYAFTTSGTASFKVRAYDSVGGVSDWYGTSVNIDTAPVPIEVAFTSPTAAQTVLIDLGGYQDVVYNIHVTSTSTAAILPSGINFIPDDPTASVVSRVDNGGGDFTIIARYPAALQAGSRTVKPQVQVTDVRGVSGNVVDAFTLTLNTVSASNHAPSLTVTVPASPTTTAFTTKPTDLAFVVSDPDGDAVTYTVDWGDGSPVSTATPSGDTKAGVLVTLTHAYADSFTASTRPATVRVNATDRRSSNSNAIEQTRLFNIQYNTYPAAAIASPQASATLPANSSLTGGVPAGYVNPAGADDPDIVVIPNGGKLHFKGVATPPGSGENTFTYAWTFPNGVPMTASTADAGEVTFIVPPGTITPILVEFKVTDAFGRWSTSGPSATPKTYRKWVVVDGVNMQTFQLSYMFRKRNGDTGTSTLTPAKTAANGYGDSVQIFQDGVNYTYAIRNGSGQAVISVPVRSNLPFYSKFGNFVADNRSFVMRIPNAPSGPFADPGLGTVINPGRTSFGFQNATPPYNPALQIVMGEGFADENTQASERRIQGVVGPGMTVGTTPSNERFLDRLAAPLLAGDPLGAIQWAMGSNFAAGFQGIRANQSFGEWVTLWLNISPKDVLTSETPVDTESSQASSSQGFGFNVDTTTFTSDTAKSKTFAQNRLQAFRVPPGSTDPYDLNVAGWSSPETISNLNPVQISDTIAPFYDRIVWGSTGTTPLAGGIQGFEVPYDANDPNRLPYSPRTYSLANIRQVFTYSEYLWSSVWARPAALNRASLSWQDTHFALSSYPYFRHSEPANWPKKSGIAPDNSAFNMNVTGGTTFNPASSPVGVGGAPAASTGVGRFYWTAFTPHYGIPTGAAISRTWLSTAEGMPPTTFNGGPGDATAAFGFLQPQDVVVDKRGRNADGSLNGQPLGGYRVTWYNPTKDSSGNTVPPDFWVVEINFQGENYFLIPANFPAGAQSASDLILTDARTYLPSGRSGAEGPAEDHSDQVAPGYCWFDVPAELRPNVLMPDSSTLITVSALKSILKNNPAAGARTLTQPEWIDAVKTVTTEMTMATPWDVTLFHKIPFNYFWDIVVVNGPITYVAP